jgi:hypothetical protein
MESKLINKNAVYLKTQICLIPSVPSYIVFFCAFFFLLRMTTDLIVIIEHFSTKKLYTVVLAAFNLEN